MGGKFNPARATRSDFTRLFEEYMTQAQVDVRIQSALTAYTSAYLEPIQTRCTDWYTPTYNEVVAARGVYETLSARLAATDDAIAAEGRARAAADLIHDAALVELIDNGAKNLINTIDLDAIKAMNTSGTWNGSTYTRYNIEYTLNGDGTISLRTVGGAATNGGALVFPCRPLTGEAYHLNGVPSGASGYDLRVGSGSTYRDTGSGLDFVVTGTYNIYTRVDSGTNIPDAVTLYPMICLKKAYDISERSVPYCPTLSEMYAMIKALQSGSGTQAVTQQAQLTSLRPVAGLTTDTAAPEAEVLDDA